MTRKFDSETEKFVKSGGYGCLVWLAILACCLLAGCAAKVQWLDEQGRVRQVATARWPYQMDCSGITAKPSDGSNAVIGKWGDTIITRASDRFLESAATSATAQLQP